VLHRGRGKIKIPKWIQHTSIAVTIPMSPKSFGSGIRASTIKNPMRGTKLADEGFETNNHSVP